MSIHTLLNAGNFNLFTFAAHVVDEQVAINTAFQLELIPKEVHCPQCYFPMTLENKPSYKLGMRWRCRRRHCNKPTISPLENTFFDNAKLPLLKVFRLLACFFFRVTVMQAALHCEVSHQTSVDMYSFASEVCRVVYEHDIEQIGGPGDVVEVDESHLFTRKFHRSRDLRRQFWVFGGISRLTGKRFIRLIRNKHKSTLWPLMQQHIAQGSFIISDQHASYTNCAQLGFSGHCAVNHFNHSVHPISAFILNGDPSLATDLPHLNLTRVKCQDNNLERSWRKLKKDLKTCRSTAMLPKYIGEYLYRENILSDISSHPKDMGLRFFKFIQDVQRVYPGPFRESVKVENCQCLDCHPN